MTPIDALCLLAPHIESGATIACPNDATRDAIQAAHPDVTTCLGDALGEGDEAVDVFLLTDGAVATRGISGPVLIASAIERTRPGGLIAILVESACYLASHNKSGGLTAETLEHLVRERGLDLFACYSPGVGAYLGQRPYRGLEDAPIDRTPGLLDAGPFILALARTWQSSEERSRHFFASLPTRLAAASAICLHPEGGRLLGVFDNFKNSWTLPGGVVDKYESPEQGAIRECLEEAGVPVTIQSLGGIFTHSDPERLHFLYLAEPAGEDWETPVTAHPHEIDAVAWLTFAQAEAQLSPNMWAKVRRCLTQPGTTWAYRPDWH